MNIYHILTWILLQIVSGSLAETGKPGLIVIKVKDSVVTETSNVSLVCVTSTVVGRIKWFLNGKRFAVTKRQKADNCSISRSSRDLAVICRGPIITLVVKNITSRDTGDWHCEDPQAKKTSKSLKLNVIKPTTITTTTSASTVEPDLPSFVALYVETAKVVAGVTPMLLTCTSHCDSSFTFGWDYGNLTGNVSRVVRAAGVCSQSLTLWVTWQHDKHVVTCTVRNPATSKAVTENTTLNLFYMPLDPIISIQPSGPIQEGDLVNITCSPRVYGKPRGRTTIVFRAGVDRSMTATNYINFTASRDDDRAEIRCIAVNIHTVGNSSYYTTSRHFNVLYSPRLKVTTNISISDDGTQSATFTCTARGNPDNATFFEWKHMSGHLVVRELVGDNSPTQSVLRMTSLRYVDSGMYICNATNGVGRNTTSFSFHFARITVEGPPYFPDNNGEDMTTVTTFPNTTLTLTFRYLSNPEANVMWYLDGLVLDTNKTGLETGSSQEKVKVDMYGIPGYQQGREERLVLDSATPDDDGDYHITACNIHGCRNSTVFRLTVSEELGAGVISPIEDNSPNMGMIIGIAAVSAIFLIIIIIIIALLVQRKKCGTHYTTDESEEKGKNGVSTVKGEVCVYSTLRDEEERLAKNENDRYQGNGDTEKESVMVIVRSGNCENSMLLEPRAMDNDETQDAALDSSDMGAGVDLSVENLNTDLREAPVEEEEEEDQDDPQVSEETKKIVTEIYSHVQKPRSSCVSDDVTNDVTEDADDGDAFKDEETAEKADSDAA